jgi:hypothetical protein
VISLLDQDLIDLSLKWKCNACQLQISQHTPTGVLFVVILLMPSAASALMILSTI